MVFRVYKMPEFNKQVDKYFSKEEKIQLEKILDELKENGNEVGKILSYKYLREKKLRGKRIYYLIYEDIVLILLIAISKKKNQKKTIENIKEMIPYYRRFIEELI